MQSKHEKGKVIFSERPEIKELKEIKTRQKARKKEGKPAKITNDMLYEMLSDVLENQARIMNYLERGKFN
ncbi:MAG: hypothetical protein M1489_04610 [Firmicutes bacterium]|nr:hypothetical protein [Bacillota bacterium]